MFKLLKNNRGQGIAAQYALTFVLIVSTITAMTVYFKRAVQGRIHDATVFMVRTVHNVYPGNVYGQYEPYYAETGIDRETESTRTAELMSSFKSTSGIFAVTEEINTRANSYANQARPGLAK